MTRPFSVLMPVYRGDDPRFLERAFRSVVDEQTRKPAEVVLVQDGPVPDETAETIERLVAGSAVPTRLVRLPENRGLAEALTVGLAECAHDIVARMDADDVSLSSRFERQLPLIESGLDLVGAGMFEFIDDTGGVVGRRTPPVGEAEIRAYSRFHDPFNHPTVVYRKAAVEAAGGYQELGLMEDYWLFARMILSGARVANLPDALVMYRIGAGAYARRGGLGQLRAELRLQRSLRRIGFTTRGQQARNLLVRGGYRLVPEAIRKPLYRRFVARGPVPGR